MRLTPQLIRDLMGILAVACIGAGVGGAWGPWFGLISFGGALYFLTLIGTIRGDRRPH